jgi:hypothetical protein
VLLAVPHLLSRKCCKIKAAILVPHHVRKNAAMRSNPLVRVSAMSATILGNAMTMMDPVGNKMDFNMTKVFVEEL